MVVTKKEFDGKSKCKALCNQVQGIHQLRVVVDDRKPPFVRGIATVAHGDNGLTPAMSAIGGKADIIGGCSNTRVARSLW